MYSSLWYYRKSFLLPKRRFKIIAFVPALTCVIVGRGIRGWKLETTVVRVSHIEHLQRCFLLLKYKEGYLNFPETVQFINFLGWRTWLRLNVQSSKYPSGSFCLTHCLTHLLTTEHCTHSLFFVFPLHSSRMCSIHASCKLYHLYPPSIRRKTARQNTSSHLSLRPGSRGRLW